MKHLRNWRLFEGDVPVDTWRDFKEFFLTDIIDKWDIPEENVYDTPVASLDYFSIPSIGISPWKDFDKKKDGIVEDLIDLHSRVYSMFGLFIQVKSFPKSIIIRLNNYPNNNTIIKDFNLREVKSENMFDNSKNGVCDYDTSIKIIQYLNGFYRFVYDSDITLFRKCYSALAERYRVDLLFSLPKFETSPYNQKLCYKFDLKDRFEEVIGSEFPIFVFDTSRIYSPYIRTRISSTSWNDIYPEWKMLDYLKEKRF